MMQLMWSPTSPYVRKVTLTAHETGLHGAITRVQPPPTGQPAPELRAINPLRKVPTLVTEDGMVMFDSVVICEYLDAMGSGGLFPAAGRARWRMLTHAALADGMMDAAVIRIMEARMRPEERRHAPVDVHQKEAVDHGLAALEKDVAALTDGPVSYAQLVVGATLGYLDFRFGHEPWRERAPKLGAWFEGFARRPSMVETTPKG